MNDPSDDQAHGAEPHDRLRNLQEDDRIRRIAHEQMLERMMDLQRSLADRDHLIRELAEMLLVYVELIPKKSIDVGPASRLYNRAQSLAGWKDDE